MTPPPVWTNAVTATAWAVMALIALWTSWRHSAMRHTAWFPLWATQAPIALWWAALNVARWAGALSTVQYRDAVAPIVPGVLALWAATAVVFCVRAKRTQQVVDLITSGETHDTRDS